MATLTSITALTPNTTTTNAPYVSDIAGALGFPQLGTNSSVIFRVTFDGAVTNVDPTDFTLNPDAIAAGGAIGTVVATDATNTSFDVQVVGLGNFDGELTLSISPTESITDFIGVSPTISTFDDEAFRVTFDSAVSDVDIADFTLNQEAIDAGGTIASVVATDATNTVFDVQVVGLDTFVGATTLSISPTASITDLTGTPTITNYKTFQVTFDVAVSNVKPTDFTLNQEAIDDGGTIASVVATDATNTVFDVQVVGLDAFAGAVTLSISPTESITGISPTPSETFRVTFDSAVSTVDPTDFTLNQEAIDAGGTIASVVATDATNTVFDVQVVGLDTFVGATTLSISPTASITGLTGTPTITNYRTFLLETTQPGIASILRVSDLDGTLVTDPNVNNASVLFQVTFTEAVRNVDISDFVPVGSAVISGVSVTNFSIANNAIRFTDVNGVTYADTYVYTVSGLDGLSGNLGLALSQGVNGISDVDGTSLITTDPPQGQDLDQTYTINNLSTTTFVSVVASDADAREEATDVNVISDNFPDSQVPSPLPYSIATTANSDDGRIIQIQFTDSQGVPVNVTLPDPEDFQITAVLPRPVVSDGQVLGTGVIPNTVEALGESYLVTVTGLRNYTGTPTIRLSGTQDLQPASGDTFQASFGEATRNATSGDIGGIDANGNTITGTVDVNGDPVQVLVGSIDGTTDSVNIEVTFNRDMLNVDSTDFDVVVSNLTPIDTGLTITGVTQVVSETGLYNLVIEEANPAANTFDGTARIDLNPNTDLVPSGNQTSGDTGTFTIARTGSLSGVLTVRFRLDNVGNTQDSDYQVSGNNLTVDAATNTYTVDIPALATETIVTITPTNDLALETTEIVRLVVLESTVSQGVVGYYEPQSSAEQASVFITDNLSTQEEDLTIPRVTIEATDPIADEETGESARFVINIAGNDDAAANPDGLSIAIVAGGSAVIGEDYVIEDADGIRFSDLATFINANLTNLAVGIDQDPNRAGDQIEFFVIPNRDFVAGNRTVTFTIQSSSQNPFLGDQSDYTVGTPFVAGATILDVDAPIAIPDISIVASDPVGSESNKDTLTFTLTRTTASTGPVTVFLQVGGDATAFEGELPPPDEQLLPEGVDYITDYQVTGGLIAVTFNEGETLKTITVTPIDDLDLDNGFTDEVISLTVLPSAFYTISDNATATGVIVNDEEPAIVIIEPASEVSEGGLRTFTVRIDGNAIGQDLRVTFNVGGSATNPNLLADANGSTDTGPDAGDDYYIPDLLIETEEDAFGNTRVSTTAPTVVIPAGSTSATFTVQTIDDGLGLDDDGETVIINLTAGEGYVVGTQNESTLTIRDINDRGVVNLNVTDATAQESDLSVASYVLERSGDNLQAVAVTFDVTGTATFGADYRIAAYDLDNPSVNLLAGVTNPVVNGVFTLTLPQGSPLNTTAADPQQIRIDIVPINDLIRDNTSGAPETVTLALQQSSQDPTRGPSRLYSIRDGETTGSVNIVDDDPLISPTITLDSVVDNLTEGSTTTITIRLVGGNIFGSEIPISFALGGTAVLGTDYTLTDASGVAVTNSIVFTSNDIQDINGDGSIDAVVKTLTLTAITDGVGFNDDGETLIFSLTEGAGYSLTGTTSETVNLRDRPDRGTVTVAATDATARESANDPTSASTTATIANPGVFTFTRTGDNLDTTLQVTFNIDGTAIAGTDYFLTVDGALVDNTAGVLTANPDGTYSFNFAAAGVENGTQTATVTVNPLFDNLFEGTSGSETINLTLVDGANYSVPLVNGDPDPAQTTANITLLDDEVALPPTVTIVAIDSIAKETLGTADPDRGTYRIYRGVLIAPQNSGLNPYSPDFYDPDSAQSLSQYLATQNQTVEEYLRDSNNYINQGNTDQLDLTVNFTVSGSATAGTDYTNNLGTSVVIPAGQNFVDIDLNPIDDALANDNSETVILTLQPSSNTTNPTYLLGDTDAVPTTATVTILDNDGNAPTIGVETTTAIAVEGGADGVFTIRRTQDDNFGSPITVNFTLSGVATPADYTPLSNVTFNSTTGVYSVVIPASTDSVTIVVDAINEGNNATNPEANETVILTLNSGNYIVGAVGNAGAVSTLTITENSGGGSTNLSLPQVSIGVVDALAHELQPDDINITNRTAQFVVNFPGNTTTTNPGDDLAILVQIEGTATLGEDYYVTSPDLQPDNQPIVAENVIRIFNIPADFVGSQGLNTVTLLITPFDDVTPELDETVTLRVLPSNRLTEFGGAASDLADYNLDPVVANRVATVTIRDNDVRILPNVTVTASDDPIASEDLNPEAGEPDENTATFTFTRDIGTATGTLDLSEALTVNYVVSGTATSGIDYIAIPGSVTIQPGQTSATVTITPRDDLDIEGAETVTVQLIDPADDTYTFSNTADFASITILDDENPTSLPFVTVDNFLRERDANGQLKVLEQDTVIISPDDDSSILVKAGTAFFVDETGNIVTSGVVDRAFEGSIDETLGNLTQQQRQGSFTFTRSDTNLNQSLTVNFTFSGTALISEDYTSTGLTTQSITFAPGEKVKSIYYLPTDDTLVEGDENVTVSLQSGTNYTIGNNGFGAGAISTLVDNDLPPTITLEAFQIVNGQRVAVDPTAATAPDIQEGAIASFIYRITRSDIGSEPLTVGFSFSPNQSAQRETDFTLVPQGSGLANSTDSFVTFAPGQNQVEFALTALANSDFIDDGEQVILTLSASSEYLLADQDTITATIRDRSDKGNINLSFSPTANAQGTETNDNSDPVIFTLTRTGDNLDTVKVPFTLTGQADPGDYNIAVYRYDIDPSSGLLSTTRTQLTSDELVDFFNGDTNFENLTSGLLQLPAFPSATDFDPSLHPVTGTLIPQVIEIQLNPIVDNVIDRTGGKESVILTITESTNVADNYTIGGNLEETESSLEGTIFDSTGDTLSNRPIVEIVATDASAFEGGDDPLGIFTLLVRDRQGNLLTLTENLTVNFTLGPATSADIGSQDGAPADYILRSNSPSLQANSIVIPAGQSSITLIVESQDDGISEEPEEFVEILLTTGFDYDQSTTLNSAIVSIVENEPAPFVPRVSIEPISTIASERTGGVGTFRISRTINGDEVNATSAKFLEGVTLTLGGDASFNTDYNLFIVRPSGTRAAVTEALNQISILSGEQYVDVEVVAKQDQEPEVSETVTLAVTGGSPTTYSVNQNQSSATVTITDGNIVSGVEVSVALASSFTDAELTALGIDLANIAPRITGDTLEEDSNQPRTVFIVSRSGGDTVDPDVTQDFNGDGILDENDTRRSQALIVNLDTTTGTATPNEDYGSLAPTVTIPIGRDAVAIEVTPISDTIADTGGDESVVVTIAPNTNGSYTPVLDADSQPSSASVFIVDNENNAPELAAGLLDEFVLNEDAGAVVLKNANNRTFAQLVQDAFSDEDTEVPENDNETLKAIKFITLPGSGRLTLNGVEVTANQVVEFATDAEISEFLESLRYQPNADFFGLSDELGGDPKSRPDRFTIVANDGAADSRETDIVINVRPVNDAPFYVLPGETGFNGGSEAAPTDFYRDSAVIGNRAFSGGDTRNFALLPGASVTIRDFVQGGANEPNPVVGPQNERVSAENSAKPAGNQELTFSTTVIDNLLGDLSIFTEAPTISADGTLRFTLRSDIPGGFGTAQVQIRAKDDGGTANNGIDTLTKGFFIVTADENTLGQVIQSFETPVGGTGSLIYNTTAFPVGSTIRVNLINDVLNLGTDAALDNIVGLYEIADPTGAIDTDGDGIGDISPTSGNRAAYARAALLSHLNNGSLQTFNLRAGSDGDANKNSTVSSFNRQGQATTGIQQGVVVEGGKLYAPFIIANGGSLISSGSGGTIAGAIGTFLTAVNPNNSPVSNPATPVAYFSFSEANPDGFAHLRYISNQNGIGIFGFEDLPGNPLSSNRLPGDGDFNDAIFGFQFIAPVIA